LIAYEPSLVNDPVRLRSFNGAAPAAVAAHKARDYYLRMVEIADSASDVL
jgi:hypothetical protein